MDIMGLVIPAIIAIIFLAIIFHVATQGDRRKKMLIELKKKNISDCKEGEGIIVEGVVGSKGKHLPSTGEECAFYSITIKSKKMVYTPFSEESIDFRYLQKGFEFSEISGDFFIKSKENGNEYMIGITKFIDKIKRGEILFSPFTKYNVPNNFSQNSEYINLILRSVFRRHTTYGGSTTTWMNKSTKTINKPIVESTIDIKVSRYIIGKQIPKGILKLLKEKGITGSKYVKNGDEIYAIETYIPIGKNIFVVGNYSKVGDTRLITHQNDKLGLSVSYEDPIKITATSGLSN